MSEMADDDPAWRFICSYCGCDTRELQGSCVLVVGDDLIEEGCGRQAQEIDFWKQSFEDETAMRDAEIERLKEYVQDIICEAGQVCGCGYDKPEDICLAHKKKMDAQDKKIERLKEELQEARMELLAADGQYCDWLEEREKLKAEVKGLEADLGNAVEVAYYRGAEEWTELNHPDLYRHFSGQTKSPDTRGEGG